MKKIIFFIMMNIFLVSCSSLSNKESLKINLVKDDIQKEKVEVKLFAYDERIADKAATLISTKEVELTGKETSLTFEVPKKTDENTYYVTLGDMGDYKIDYSEGSIEKLEVDKDNSVKIIKKSH